MKITNEDIVSAAKTLRVRQERMLATPANPLAAKHSKTPWIAAAACIAGFVVGFGTRPLLTDNTADGQLAQSDSLQQVMQAVSAEPKVITEVVHDTVFRTKVVTREVVRHAPLVAEYEQTTDSSFNQINNNPGQSAAVGCSMMCDNISYDLIASKN